MAAKQKKGRRVGAGGIILGLLLALVLGGGVVAGAWWWGGNQPVPEDLREGRSVTSVDLDLYEPGETVTGEAPVPAEAPDVETASGSVSAGVTASDGYTYAEIIAEEDGLIVARLQGKRYKGFVAVVSDPMRLQVATCPYFGDGAYGRTVNQMADDCGAVLAINGGGFKDDGGNGLGGTPTGNVVADGVMRWAGGGSTVGMDYDGKLHVGEFSGNDCRDMGLYWAVAYGPTLIVDGSIRSGLDNSQAEPRTAVGQREDGSVVLVNIQGRQASALGVTCRQLAYIMSALGCVNAGNLDEGASSDMYYRGEFLNIANTSGGPRPLPTAVMVMPAGNEEAEG